MAFLRRPKKCYGRTGRQIKTVLKKLCYAAREALLILIFKKALLRNN
jgi:hypothetical protein